MKLTHAPGRRMCRVSGLEVEGKMMEKLRPLLRRTARLLSPPRAITLGFAAMIAVGALLLTLPVSSADGQSVGFLNALFTATSATCVTGLVVVNTQAHWTLFGKAVILLLIQLGGLGFMTVLTLILLVTRRRISLRNRAAIQASFNQDGIGGMVRLVRRVIVITAVFELTGAVLLFVMFYATGEMTVVESAIAGIFHSISAFCNAGFDNIGPDSLIPYQSHAGINAVIMILIIAGGLGFTVWTELATMARNRKHRSLHQRLAHVSLHSKLALVTTFVLIAAGTALFLLFEWDNPNTLGAVSSGRRVLPALFQSVTLRTAGFVTMEQAGLTDISKFTSAVLMAIGGSPAGTAGGMKTVTVAVIVMAMVSALRGNSRIEAFGRTIPLDILQKALTVACAMLVVISLSTVALHFSERASAFDHGFLDLLFETASAAGTVGISTGLTPHLSPLGKLVLILCMFLGRLSPVTVVVALNVRMAGPEGATYPQERVIIG